MKCDHCRGNSLTGLCRLSVYHCHRCECTYDELYLQYKMVCSGCLNALISEHQQSEHASVDLV